MGLEAKAGISKAWHICQSFPTSATRLQSETHTAIDGKDVRLFCTRVGSVRLRESLSCCEAKPKAISIEGSKTKSAGANRMDLMANT